ncbi:hypothetical protein [Candidatus Vampirococcus lugosii]|uniref:PilN domain-containing protein n=1 Tax=Candidatus Vampirococcus lugosii TaxID=2789015 RepID=A0ABS5QMR8_9BACT|nr:hypothetical protein [Candidatus Vampirococcus lugosii]MBS8122488.1 hypothetical protein [Candidatus Vampirococcus lugosii]
MSFKLKILIRSIKNDIWKHIFFVFFLLFCVSGGFYIHNIYMSSLYDSKIDDLEITIQENLKKYENLRQEDNYMNFEIAQHIQENKNKISWVNNIESLVEMFDRVSSVGSNSDISLENFLVNYDSIRVRGSVPSLETVYNDDGLLDELNSLDFINEILIPSYSLMGDKYEFDLTSKIKLNEGR